jgi:hypothetical protein
MRLLATLLLLAGAPAPQDAPVKKVVPDADKIRKSARKIPPAGQAKIEKALGEKLEAADLSPAMYECVSIVPQISSAEPTPCRVVFLTAKGPKGPIQLGVAVAWLESTVHAVKVLSNADAKEVEAPEFLSPFSGFEYSANLANPPDVLAAALKKAAEGKDDASKELDGLVRMLANMRAMESAWRSASAKAEKKDRTLADDAAALDRLFDESVRLLPALKFVKPAAVDKYKGFASVGKTAAGELKTLAAGGKFDDAYRKAGWLEGNSCSRCHGAYKRSFREARLERSIGNGYFSLKLDVGAPDPANAASYQAVATAVRKAVLLASEAR